MDPLPVPPAALAAAAADYAAALAAVNAAYASGGRSASDALIPALGSAAFHYSVVAGAVLANDGWSPATARWSAVADSALWTAIRLGWSPNA